MIKTNLTCWMLLAALQTAEPALSTEGLRAACRVNREIHAEAPPGGSEGKPLLAILEWSAPGAQFVLLPGAEARPQAAEGTRWVDPLVVYTIVAVFEGRIETQLVGCALSTAPSVPQSQPLLPLNFLIDSGAAYTRDFVADSLELEDVDGALRIVLQSEGFGLRRSVEGGKFRVLLTDTQPHYRLCIPEDCAVGLKERRVEREVLFRVTIELMESNGQVAARTSIEPIVFERYRLEGGSWKWVENGASIGKDLTDSLLLKISGLLEKK